MDTEIWSKEDLDLLSEAFKAGSDYRKAAQAKEAQARIEREAGNDKSRIIPVSDLGHGLRTLATQAQKGKRR